MNSSPTVICGLSEPNGSWNTIWMFLRSRRISSFLSFVKSLPSNRISPLFGSVSRMTILPTVVFPQPLSPTRPNVSPAPIKKLTPSTAHMAHRPLQHALCNGKVFFQMLHFKQGFHPYTSRAPPAAFFCARQQQTVCSGPTVQTPGRSRAQISMRTGQRSWNAQPAGISAKFGTLPSML